MNDIWHVISLLRSWVGSYPSFLSIVVWAFLHIIVHAWEFPLDWYLLSDLFSLLIASFFFPFPLVHIFLSSFRWFFGKVGVFLGGSSSLWCTMSCICHVVISLFPFSHDIPLFSLAAFLFVILIVILTCFFLPTTFTFEFLPLSYEVRSTSFAFQAVPLSFSWHTTLLL